MSIIIIIISFSACKALKPVVNHSPASNAAHAENSHTGFIENITIRPGSPTATPGINNNNPVNTFTVQTHTPEAFIPLQFKYAILMDIPVEALANLKLFAFIDEWYGTPYHFGGGSKDGIDCSAFTGNLMTTVFGIGLPRMAKEQYNVCEHIQKSKLEEGDLVFFHTTRRGISHVGVYLGNNKFVHASVNYGVTISDMSEGYYAHAFRGGGRVKQADNMTAAGN